jgi:hypothetical protein
MYKCVYFFLHFTYIRSSQFIALRRSTQIEATHSVENRKETAGRVIKGVPSDSNHHTKLEQVPLQDVLLLLLQFLHVPAHRGEPAGEPIPSLTREPD